MQDQNKKLEGRCLIYKTLSDHTIGYVLGHRSCLCVMAAKLRRVDRVGHLSRSRGDVYTTTTPLLYL